MKVAGAAFLQVSPSLCSTDKMLETQNELTIRSERAQLYNIQIDINCMSFQRRYFPGDKQQWN